MRLSDSIRGIVATFVKEIYEDDIKHSIIGGEDWIKAKRLMNQIIKSNASSNSLSNHSKFIAKEITHFVKEVGITENILKPMAAMKEDQIYHLFGQVGYYFLKVKACLKGEEKEAAHREIEKITNSMQGYFSDREKALDVITALGLAGLTQEEKDAKLAALSRGLFVLSHDPVQKMVKVLSHIESEREMEAGMLASPIYDARFKHALKMYALDREHELGTMIDADRINPEEPIFPGTLEQLKQQGVRLLKFTSRSKNTNRGFGRKTGKGFVAFGCEVPDDAQNNGSVIGYFADWRGGGMRSYEPGEKIDYNNVYEYVDHKTRFRRPKISHIDLQNLYKQEWRHPNKEMKPYPPRPKKSVVGNALKNDGLIMACYVGDNFVNGENGEVIGSDIGHGVKNAGHIEGCCNTDMSATHWGGLGLPDVGVDFQLGIGNGVTVEENTKIEISRIGDHCRIQKDAVVENSVVGDGVIIPEKSQLFQCIVLPGYKFSEEMPSSKLKGLLMIPGVTPNQCPKLNDLNSEQIASIQKAFAQTDDKNPKSSKLPSREAHHPKGSPSGADKTKS